MFKRRAKIGEDEYVWGVEAAKILRIGRTTFYERHKLNHYPDIEAIRFSNGFKYRLRDVVSAAHPSLSKEKIDDLVTLYRIEGFRKVKKKAEKRGRKK